MNQKKNRLIYTVLLIIACVCVNLAGNSIAAALGLPLYLDAIGTVVGSALGGYIPGIIIGLVTNLITSISAPEYIYYASLNVLIAVVSAYMAKKGWFNKPGRIPLAALILSLIGGGLGAILTWFLYDFSADNIRLPFILGIYEQGLLPAFPAQLISDLFFDFIDKLITVAICFLVWRFFPARFRSEFHIHAWRQKPLDEETENRIISRKTRRSSLKTKLAAFIVIAMAIISVLSIIISTRLFTETIINDNTRLGTGVASLAANTIPPDRVTDFIENGENAPGYTETENRLYAIRRSSPDIQFVYVYRIEEDGIHVVFDLDTEEVEADEPGSVLPFDESFREDIPALLAGEPIEPKISNDTFGWLLTVYIPVYDDNGVCQCYAAADISMVDINRSTSTYVAQMVSLFLGFFILILMIVLWYSEYNIVYPVNTMSDAASTFAVGSDESRRESLEQIKSLDIRTGDEIEDLYNSFSKTTADCIEYADRVRKTTEMLNEMQNGLISVLADVVESRDKCTGDHVRKTALYARLIMEEMIKEEIYVDQMTPEFVNEVFYSAPLHDVGKIKVPDAILNKPGRLTDEEFDIMKTHTTEGSDIIDQAISIVPDPMYLKETKNLSMYHHEKWNGTGYPSGLKGEEIPLSARIMAVADVFDALVSERSYKKGMPFDVAFGIIEDGAGSHFDPYIAQAFLNRKEDAMNIARMKLK